MTKHLILKIIKIYQKTLSCDHGFFSFYQGGYGCRFYPSCSEYTYQAVEKFGATKGLLLGFLRIVKCHPFSKGGYDPLKK